MKFNLQASPLLLISAAGIWFAVALTRNLRSVDPYYTIHRARFHKVVAPAWFYLFTAFYFLLALALIGLPLLAVVDW
ncbi:MAG TPA: hypothetical protein VJ483_09500 [Holophagaceae bacterium]|nr:hypothetical protein [Holophagaceae bacterium]